MGLMTSLKARMAYAKQQKGEFAEAMKLYGEALDAGMNDARYILNYTVLLIRDGQYQKARELLVKIQKSPLITADQRRQLLVNYSACVYKMGELEKGISVLEQQHQKAPSGLIYETLGYLYVEAGDADKALAYNQEALDYDDEDAIVLDNMGQVYYRMLGDKAKAKEYFDRAHALKEKQIDTLYFLAQYDLEAGDKEAAKAKLETALGGRFSPLNYASREMVQSQLDSLQ